MLISNVIDEADILVPNSYSANEKLPWLNSINSEFFDVVKVPQVELFPVTAGASQFILGGNIKGKTIDKVMVGTLKYLSFDYDDVQPGQNYYLFDEVTKALSLSYAPSRSGSGIIRYRQSTTTIYTTGIIGTATPDAPAEYHWIYVIGLAEYIAKANEEEEKAVNYGGQYRNALQVAAQNYQRNA